MRFRAHFCVLLINSGCFVAPLFAVASEIGVRKRTLANWQLRLAGIADVQSACERLGCASEDRLLPGSNAGAIAFKCKECRVGSDEEHKQLPGEVCAVQPPYGPSIITLRQGEGHTTKRLSAQGGHSAVTFKWGTDKHSSTLPLSYCKVDTASTQALEYALLKQTPFEGSTVVTFALSIHTLHDRFFYGSDFNVKVTFQPHITTQTELYEDEAKLTETGVSAYVAHNRKRKRMVNVSSVAAEAVAQFQVRRMKKGTHFVMIVSASVPFSQTDFDTGTVGVDLECANKGARCKLDRFALCGRVTCVMSPSNLKTLLYLRDASAELKKQNKASEDVSQSIEDLLDSGRSMDFLHGRISKSDVSSSTGGSTGGTDNAQTSFVRQRASKGTKVSPHSMRRRTRSLNKRVGGTKRPSGRRRSSVLRKS